MAPRWPPRINATYSSSIMTGRNLTQHVTEESGQWWSVVLVA